MYSQKVFIVAVFFSVLVSVFCAPIDKRSDEDDFYRSAHENPNLFGGDIVLPEANNKFGIRPSYYRWPNNTIPYTIAKERMNLKEQIEKAMRHIEDTTCIRFVPHTIETDYVYIFLGDGCWSSYGKQGGAQDLSLGPKCERFGTIVHELMHAIGFFHEHQRPDRDRHLNIHWENVDPTLYSQFEKLPISYGKIYAPFDFKSIMLYDSKTFSKNGNETMTPKDSRNTLIPVWQKQYLSESDILNVNKLYNCV